MKIMDRQDIQICIPKVPQQPNYTDCGLYTVQYIKQIMENQDGSNAFESWSDHGEVRIMRNEIELVQTLSKEQRQQGGVLEG